MEFRDISILNTQMSDEQKAEAKADFDRFYTTPFGQSESILCSSEKGENFLRKVDLKDFE